MVQSLFQSTVDGFASSSLSRRSSYKSDSVDSVFVEDGRLRRDLGGDLGGCLGLKSKICALLLVVNSRFNLAFRLQSRNDVLIFPSDLVRKPAKDAEFAVGLESEDAESGWNHGPLSLIVGGRNSFIGAVAFHGVLATSQLMRQHTADGFVEDS